MSEEELPQMDKASERYVKHKKRSEGERRTSGGTNKD